MTTGSQLLRLTRAAAVAAAIACACAGDAGTESLVNNSPFLPQSAVVQVSNGGALDNFELRGVASFGGVQTFSIFDATNNRGYWVPLNGSEGGVRVASYDPATEAVVLEGEGGSRRLFLKEAQIQTMMPPAPAPAGTAVQGTPLPVPPGGITTEQEMAERRQRIIEELRRRRALRQQAQGQPAPQ